MTHSEFATLLAGTRFDTAYDHFTDDTEHELPFICFLYPNRRDVVADNTNFQSIEIARVEFYSQERDFASEDAIGNALNSAGLVYTLTSEFLSDEEMWMTLFDTSFVLTEEIENANEE